MQPTYLIKHLCLALALCFSHLSLAQEQASICYGSIGKGKLEHGHALPAEGKNFKTYSMEAVEKGYVTAHHKVASIVIAAYEWMAMRQPFQTLIYADASLPEGGKFPPHITHQNGTSVDFMVPVLNQDGLPAQLERTADNRWGYDIEFDENGRYGDYIIDFETMAMHIYALQLKAKAQRSRIARVIFAPELRPFLFNTEYGVKLNDIYFYKKAAKVRHDEHYHIDFKVKCQPLVQPQTATENAEESE